MSWLCKDMEASAELDCCVFHTPYTIRSYMLHTWLVITVCLDMRTLKSTYINKKTCAAITQEIRAAYLCGLSIVHS